MTWDAEGLTPAVLGTGTGERTRVQQAILDAHHEQTGQVVFPRQITNNTNNWQQQPELEFLVVVKIGNGLEVDKEL